MILNQNIGQGRTRMTDLAGIVRAALCAVLRASVVVVVSVNGDGPRGTRTGAWRWW